MARKITRQPVAMIRISVLRALTSHPRSWLKGRHTTLSEHMPEAHRQYGDWSPQRFRQWAKKIGPATAQVITSILTSRKHPQQGYRACLGILRLAKIYSNARLDAACQRALRLGTCRYKSIESILKHRLDEQPLPEVTEEKLPQNHDHIRGSDYYH